MKASSLVDMGQEGEGNRVDNQERNPQKIGIQVQGLLVTWNIRFMAFRIGIRPRQHKQRPPCPSAAE